MGCRGEGVAGGEVAGSFGICLTAEGGAILTKASACGHVRDHRDLPARDP